jgi:hypothetical protein
MAQESMGSLTDQEVIDLAKRMKTPLERVCFKSQLKDQPLVYNRGYVINLEDEFDQDGNPNDGTHWVALYVKKLSNGTIRPIYMDSYGVMPPEEIKQFVKDDKLPYTDKDIQSMMNQACGWYCLAFLYYISSYEGRTGDLFVDTSHFMDYFNDLNKTTDWHYNVYVLKQFFRSPDPKIREKYPVEVF